MYYGIIKVKTNYNTILVSKVHKYKYKLLFYSINFICEGKYFILDSYTGYPLLIVNVSELLAELLADSESWDFLNSGPECHCEMRNEI